MFTSGTIACHTRSRSGSNKPNNNHNDTRVVIKRKQQSQADQSKPSKARRVSKSPASTSSNSLAHEDELLTAVNIRIRAIGTSSQKEANILLSELNKDLENHETVVLDNAYTREQVVQAISGINGISTLVQVLAKHISSSEICRGVLRALQNATHENDDNKLALLIKSNGLPKILNAMDKYNDDADLQRHACGVIQNLAYENQDYKIHMLNDCKFNDAGVLTYLVKAMEEHPDKVELHWQAIGAISNLLPAMVTHEHIEKHLDLFLSSMVTHSHHPHLLERVFALLGRLASRANVTRYSMIGKKTINAVLTALGQHPHDQALQENGSLLLEILLGIDKLQSSQCDDSGKAFEHISEIDSFCNSVFQDAIRIAHGIPAILQFMQRHEDSLEIQQTAISLLACVISYEKPENRDAIIDANGVHVVLQAMNRFAKDDRLQSDALYVLKDLLKHPFGYGLFRLSDGIDIIAEAAKKVRRCDKKDAFELLLELATMTKAKRLPLDCFLEMGAHKAAVKSLQLHMHDEELAKVVLLFLKILMPLIKQVYPDDMVDLFQLVGKVREKYNHNNAIVDEMDSIM